MWMETLEMDVALIRGGVVYFAYGSEVVILNTCHMA